MTDDDRILLALKDAGRDGASISELVEATGIGRRRMTLRLPVLRAHELVEMTGARATARYVARRASTRRVNA